MRKHESFILTPISKVLDEAQFALAPLEGNIDNYPLLDYVMQSLYLKMTGFQEQKVKCISWELATDDYALRYERYKKHLLGECSSYKDKKQVFMDLVSILEKGNKGSSVLSDLERTNILLSTKSEIQDFGEKPQLFGWAEKSLADFCKLFDKCGKECVLYVNQCVASDILGHCANCSKKSGIDACEIIQVMTLIDAFDVAIQHRNRCAHNTTSFQQNLPALDNLQKKEYILENYFVRFALLMIIDKVFVALFKKYLEQMPEPFKL